MKDGHGNPLQPEEAAKISAAAKNIREDSRAQYGQVEPSTDRDGGPSSPNPTAVPSDGSSAREGGGEGRDSAPKEGP